MHRRSLIFTGAGLAVPLFLSGVSLAQVTEGSRDTNAGGMSSTPSLAGKSDAKSMKSMAAANGAASLQSSQLALQQAGNPMVKQFAQLEAEEQKNLMAAMKAMGDDPKIEKMPDDKMQAMRELQNANGAEFDRLYVASQLKAHQELLQIHQSLMQGGSESRDSVIPLLAVPAIKTHIAMLQMIQQDIGAGTASTR